MPVDIREHLRNSLSGINKFGQQATENQNKLIGLKQKQQLDQAAQDYQNRISGPSKVKINPKWAGKHSKKVQISSGLDRKDRKKAINSARKYLGIDYVYGGGGLGGPSGSSVRRGKANYGFDCSGLVQYAMGQAGIKLPRQSDSQLRAAGKRTSISNLRPGDLVGWNRGGHVAIYLGNGKIIAAPHTGGHVQVRSLGKNEGVFGVRVTYPGE